MSISADSPLDETLNRGPLALLFRRQYEFHSGIDFIFSIFRAPCMIILDVCTPCLMILFFFYVQGGLTPP